MILPQKANTPVLINARRGESAKEVYQLLRNQIMRLELVPGATIDESALVNSLGVSRTPVREALIRLAGDGLVVLLPNRGARVAPISMLGLRAFFEALDLVQRAVTRLAAERRTSDDVKEIDRTCGLFEKAVARRDIDEMTNANFEFHISIGVAAHNEYLADVQQLLLFQGARLARLALLYRMEHGNKKKKNSVPIAMAQHRSILAAISCGNANAAELIAGKHVSGLRERVGEYYAQNLISQVHVAAIK